MAKDKDDEKKEKETVIKEIHTKAAMQARVLQLESRKGRVIMSSNYPEDHFPNLSALGLKLFDHVTDRANIFEKISDEKDHV